MSSFVLEIKIEAATESARDRAINHMMAAGIDPTIVGLLNRVRYTVIGYTTTTSVVAYINEYMDFVEEYCMSDAVSAYPMVKYFMQAVLNCPRGDDLCDSWGSKAVLQRWLSDIN